MSRVRANQKPERPVSTRPLSGISVGRTTSKVEMRSLATSSRRSSSSSYSSRTFPLPTCVTASGMDCILLPGELEVAQPLEDGVDVACVPAEVEELVELHAAGDLLVRAHQLAEVLLLLVRPQRIPLYEPVGVAARQPGLDEREEQPLAEEEPVAGLEIAAHPLGSHVKALDEPGEAF